MKTRILAAAAVSALISLPAYCADPYEGVWSNDWNHSVTIKHTGGNEYLLTFYSPDGATGYTNCVLKARSAEKGVLLPAETSMHCTDYEYTDDGQEKPVGKHIGEVKADFYEHYTKDQEDEIVEYFRDCEPSENDDCTYTYNNKEKQ